MSYKPGSSRASGRAVVISQYLFSHLWDMNLMVVLGESPRICPIHTVYGRG